MGDPRKLFTDDRHKAICVFCGAVATTCEHVASRVLLDEPYPANLPVVDSCARCNQAFSKDEEYLACLVDCVLAGSTDPRELGRPKVKASLEHSAALRARIAAAGTRDESGAPSWRPDRERVRNVAIKLARGHAAHQFGEPQLTEPKEATAVPLSILSAHQRDSFEEVPKSIGWPEVGSRSFMEEAEAWDGVPGGKKWTIVQPNRYRFIVAQPEGVVVRVVLSEYLACEVAWL